MGENRFQIRHGSTVPGEGDLLPYEFGYDKTNKKLYMGQEGENPLLVNPDPVVPDPVTLGTLGIELTSDKINSLPGDIEKVDTYIKGDLTTLINGKEPKFDVLSISKGGTNASSALDAVQNLGFYPIGSVYITNTNASPASYLGGTWELIDKEFSSAVFTNPLALSSSADESNVYATRGSHSIEITGYITPKSAIAPSTILCTFNYETLGITKFYATQRIVAYSSSGNILGMFYIESGTGNLVFAATQTSGQNWPVRGAFFDMTAVIPMDLMLDSACDKFYWKRTA